MCLLLIIKNNWECNPMTVFSFSLFEWCPRFLVSVYMSDKNSCCDGWIFCWNSDWVLSSRKWIPVQLWMVCGGSWFISSGGKQAALASMAATHVAAPHPRIEAHIVWLGSVVVRALDLQSTGHGFTSWLPRLVPWASHSRACPVCPKLRPYGAIEIRLI